MSTPVHPYALDILGKVIRQEKLITQIGMKEAELPVSVGDMNLCAGNEKKSIKGISNQYLNSVTSQHTSHCIH